MKKKFWNVKARMLILFSLLTVTLGACELLELLGGVLGANALALLGVQPASNFNQSGRMQVSLQPSDSSTGRTVLGSLQAMGVRTQLRGEDGKMRDCEFVEEKTELASIYNSVVLLIDDSGSMGRSYSFCATCPHDPDNIRSEASLQLAQIVFEKAPLSEVSVMDFGPPPSPGLRATRILADFSSDITKVQSGLALVDGSIDYGTPLWDSLADTLRLLGSNAEEQEQTKLGQGKPDPTPDPIPDPIPDPDADPDVDPDVDPNPTPDPAPDPDPDTSGSTSGSTSGDTSGSTSGANENIRTDTVKRYLVLLSDGMDTTSDFENIDSVIALAKQLQIPVYAVGLGFASVNSPELAKNEEVQKAVRDLQRLASETGGFYAAADDATALREMYRQIGVAMSEGFKGAEYVCKDAVETTPGESPIGSSRKVQGAVSLGNTISLPFSFLRP